MRLKFDILELKKFLPHLIFLMVFVSFKVGSDELKEVIVDCENCPQLIEVKPGSFIKGSPQEVEGSRDDERPQHEVNIAYTFYASKFEVKRIEYEQYINDTDYDMSGGCYGATEEGIVLGEDLSWFEPGYQVSDDHPVVCVSWNDAKAYVRWLSQKTGFKYRLFSESEWEYIARAGTSTTRFWGDSDEGCEYANGEALDITPEAFLEEMKGRQSKIVLPDDWKVANCHDGYMTSSPVGSFKPNAFGIYDILGNVAEWVEDCWGNSYESTPRDGSPRLDGDCNRPILRGASYYDMPIYLRSSNHYGFESSQSENKDTRYINFGFRVMREAE